MQPIELTREEFLKNIADYENSPNEWKYLGTKPAVLDFYASWCGPCQRLHPVMEELAKEYAGKVYIYKVDTEKEEELAEAFGIRSIPTLLFIPMKGDPQMSQGALPKETIREVIDKFLLKM